MLPVKRAEVFFHQKLVEESREDLAQGESFRVLRNESLKTTEVEFMVMKEYVTKAKERRVVIGKIIIPEWVKEIFETKNSSWLEGNLKGFSPRPIKVSLGYMNLLYFGDLYYPWLMLNREGELLFQLSGTSDDICVFLENYRESTGKDFFEQGIKEQIALIQKLFEWGPKIIQEKMALLEKVRKIFPEWEISGEGALEEISSMEVWKWSMIKEFLDQNKVPLTRERISYTSLKVMLPEILDRHDLWNDFLWSWKEQAIKILDRAGLEAGSSCERAEWTSFEKDRQKNHLEQLRFVFIDSSTYVPEEVAGQGGIVNVPSYEGAIFEYGIRIEKPPICVEGTKPSIGESGYIKLGSYGRIYLIIESLLFDCQIRGEEEVISQIKDTLALLPNYWKWAAEVKEKEMAIKESYLKELKELLPTWRIEYEGVKDKRIVEEVKELLVRIEKAGIELPRKTCRDLIVPYELRDLLKQSSTFYRKMEEEKENIKKERDEKVLSLLSSFLQ